MDEWQFERAAQIEQDDRDRARQRLAAMNGPQTHPDFDGVHCVDCDVDIPAGRLALHKVRCVDCQSALE